MPVTAITSTSLGKRLRSSRGHIFRRGDEAAEYNRTEAVFNQVLDHLDGFFELLILLPGQFVGLAGHLQQACGGCVGLHLLRRYHPGSAPGATSIPSADSSSTRSRIVRRPISSRPSRFFRVFDIRSAARLRRVAAAAAGLEASERSRASADHQRTRCRKLFRDRSVIQHRFAGIIQHPLEQALIFRRELVGGFAFFPLRERGIRLHIMADICPAALDEVLRQAFALALVRLAGQIFGQVVKIIIQEGQQRAEGFFFAAVRRGSYQHDMPVRVLRPAC